MTEESSTSIDEVRTLVAERLRFDEWLEALDARRKETPDHVFDRVHGDYVARRSGVMDQLRGFVPDLEGLLAELDARATSLAARSKAEEDERAEAMLRHAVGEFDDDKWDAVRQRVESTLATLSGEAEAIEEQRNDVGSLLESARPEPDADPDADPATPSDEPEAVEAASGATVAALNSAVVSNAESDAADTADTSETAETADWLGTLTPADGQANEDAVADNGSSERRDARSAASSGEQEASEARGKAAPADDQAKAESTPAAADSALLADDDLELNTEMPAPPASTGTERTRIWGTPAGGAAPQKRDGRGSRDADAEDVFGDARSTEAPAATATTDSRRESDASGASKAAKPEAEFDELAFLRSVVEPENEKPSLPRAPAKSEEQKTLRCTECSTMNLPTEWYCERCGGELAAF